MQKLYTYMLAWEAVPLSEKLEEVKRAVHANSDKNFSKLTFHF